jgi:hypothetical protein
VAAKIADHYQQRRRTNKKAAEDYNRLCTSTRISGIKMQQKIEQMKKKHDPVKIEDISLDSEEMVCSPRKSNAKKQFCGTASRIRIVTSAKRLWQEFLCQMGIIKRHRNSESIFTSHAAISAKDS